MNDLNFHSLDVEGNIYAIVTLEEYHTKLCLIALRDCQVCCLEYKNDKPCIRKVQFAYLPTGGRILSIQVLKQGFNDFTVAIAHCQFTDINKSSFSKPRSGPHKSNEYTHDYGFYLNLYSSTRGGLPETKSIEIESIASCCQTIHLKYNPLFVLPCQLIRPITESRDRKTVGFGFVVPGSDLLVHAFIDKADTDKPSSLSYHDLEENSAEEAGLEDLAIVLEYRPIWMDMMYSDLTLDGGAFERWTCFGMENGSFVLYRGVFNMSLRKFQLVQTFTQHYHDTIIPSVKFFVNNSTYNSPIRRILEIDVSQVSENFNPCSYPIPIYRKDDIIDLLIVNGTGTSIVFEDIVNNGLEKQVELPDSQREDVLVTSAIVDTNMDGRNEIVIGGYGSELLTYQYDDETCSYYLDNKKLLNNPIYSILPSDFTNNGSKDLLILLSNGILITQLQVTRALKVGARRLDWILRCLDDDDDDDDDRSLEFQNI